MKNWLKSLRKSCVTEQKETLPGNDFLRNFVAVGYPKVGNTWLRITIGYYLYKRYSLSEMPLMDREEFQPLLNAGCHAIGDFTHYPLEWTKQRAEDLTHANVVVPFKKDRVLLLTRNPLDTMVSLFMQERYRNEQTPFTGSLEEFIEHPVFGLEKLLKFYRLWLEGRDDVADFYLWRYEDARLEPLRYFKLLLEFLRVEVEPAVLNEAVDFASFENLKALEASGRNDIVYKSSGLYVFGSTPTDNPNALHIRKGQIAGYKDELAPDIVVELERRVKAGMPAFFGYS